MKKILALILTLSVLLTACGKKTPESQKGITYDGYNGPKDAVMTINGETVSVDEFNYFLIMASYDIAAANDVVKSDRSGFWDKIDEETGKSYKQKALDDAIEKCKPYHIYRTEAKAEKVELSKDDKKAIAERAGKMKENYGEYMNELQLKAGGLTPKVYEDITEMSQYSVNLYDKFKSEYGEPSEDVIKKYYKDNYVRAKNILVLTVDTETNEAVSDDKKQEALRKIMEVKTKLDNGEDFENLINEYNEDPGYDKYPDGYTFTKDDSYDKNFIETAFSLGEGQVSDIVETQYGYMIIKRDILLDEYMSSEAISEKIVKNAFQEKLDKLCADADIRLNKSVYDSIDVEKVLGDYLNSQDEIMSKIQAEYEKIYAEEGKKPEEQQ